MSGVSALPRPPRMVSSSPTPSRSSQPSTPPVHRQHPVHHHSGRMMNLMFDPRVIRGPTQPHHPRKPDISCHEHPPLKKHAQKTKVKPTKDGPGMASEPCTARKHLDVQTDAYLEEFVEKLSEYDMDTQTDAFLDRPPTPLFIPQKSGPDVGTQIEEGDLFNFDEEVEPMLEVLVGRTIEQSVMEVMEEKQLANLHAYQEHFEQIRVAELVATQRMEAAERRINEEKKKRIQEEKKRLEEEQKIKEKTEVQMYVKGYLKNMTDSIFRTLQKLNYFYDPVERELEELYLPYLDSEIMKEIENISVARCTLKLMVDQVARSSEERAHASVAKAVDRIVSQVHTEHLVTASDVKGVINNVLTQIQ